MNTMNYGIMGIPKYESSGGMQLPRSMVTQRWRSCDMTTIRIPLNSRKYPGLYALIDEADYDMVSQYKWHPVVRPSGVIYAASGKAGAKMHRVILDAPDGMLVDHVNHDGLDNRRANIRLATQAENLRNIGRKSPCRSGYKGVHWNSHGWAADIQFDGRKIWLGRFTSPVAAACAYDIAATLYHGEFAMTNLQQGILDEGEVLSAEQLESFRIVRAGSSRFRGVSRTKDTGNWMVKITRGREQHYIGRFQTEEEAAMAHDAAAIKIFGDDAIVNFAAGITGAGQERGE